MPRERKQNKYLKKGKRRREGRRKRHNYATFVTDATYFDTLGTDFIVYFT
eukprot:m.131923 g.131923  ORF g.131923 m.131923 type:complete len:50 (-) comp14638_c0_seq1:2335-2484(-)